jgi:uncharacterized membrane protein (UPF0127 family)
MSRRARFVLAGAIAVGALIGMVVLVVHVVRSDDGTGSAAFRLGRTTPAPAPFADFARSRVAIGDKCLDVLVATTPAQRSQGLRDVRELGAYDGMIFVFSADVDVRFTMANTLVPLDIGWYGADGRRVDRTEMTPCPNGSDATCPVYASDHSYRYALETPKGQLTAGSLGPCAA